MTTAATTTLSSKGQIVIPEEIRLRLGLKAGVQFVVVADRDVVILKVLDPPALGEFSSLVAEARQAAKRSGLRQTDVSTAITKVRHPRSIDEPGTSSGVRARRSLPLSNRSSR